MRIDGRGGRMKTDELLYELFKIEPKSLLRLVQVELEGEYVFESLTIKTTEKRLDGFLHRIDGIGPNVFVEIQGYPDPTIYWRALREVSTYYEQTNDPHPCLLIVLFLDEKDEPTDCPALALVSPHHLIRAYLKPCLDAVGKQAGVLTVLKPLVVSNKQEVFEHIRDWKAELAALALPPEKFQVVLDLLEYLILQRFPTLHRKEFDTMLHLTPIEETLIGKELIQIGKQEGRQEGRQEGLTKGELIGAIRFAQKMLKQPVSPSGKLVRKSPTALNAMLKAWEAELAVPE
jgi:predicted transposase YdaD